MEERQRVNFVITDLDDTIWDWLNMWYSSFNPYFLRIQKETDINTDVLKASFKQLHQKYGTCEASYAFKELDCLNDEHKKLLSDESATGKSLLHEYNSNKKNSLKLYEGVRATLEYIKGQGTLIIGFTESNSFFTKYRIRHLGLDGLFDAIYTPMDSGVPDSVHTLYPKEHWDTANTKIKVLPKETRKPNKDILNTIISEYGGTKENTIYIGDKLDRDIFMAQEASVTSVYAQYGHLIETVDYSLLVDVTHWTDEDVKRELEFKRNFHLNKQPDYTLTSFSSLTTLFNFYGFNG